MLNLKLMMMTQTFYSPLLGKRMLLGAGIAFGLITLLVSGVKTQPGWPDLWMVRPLIIAPLGGAAGAVFYHIMDRLSLQDKWLRLLAVAIGILGYIAAIWMGSIFGLDGTLWD